MEDVLTARSGHGTRPEVIAEVLAAIGDCAVVLSYEEDRAFTGVGLGRFGAVGSTRLDWTGLDWTGLDWTTLIGSPN
jgi:hypothetical protein